MSTGYGRLGQFAMVLGLLAGAIFPLGCEKTVGASKPDAVAVVVEAPAEVVFELPADIWAITSAAPLPRIECVSLEILHVRSSVMLEDFLAIRVRGAKLLGEVPAEPVNPPDVGKYQLAGYEGRSYFPEWLRKPWVDIDGSFSRVHRIVLPELSGSAVYFVRPAAKEIVLYIQSDMELVVPASLAKFLELIRYTEEDLETIVGNDWRYYNRVKIVPQ